MAKARSMNRSRNQVATSYAPGSFFTFEGGVGACIATTAITGEQITLTLSTTRMILERLEQFSSAWFSRAMSARNDKPEHVNKFPIVPELCVDVGLLNEERTDVKLPGLEAIYFSKPSHMGYTPAPLTFTCGTRARTVRVSWAFPVRRGAAATVLKDTARAEKLSFKGSEILKTLRRVAGAQHP